MPSLGCAVSLVAIFAVVVFVIALRAWDRARQAVSEVAELRRRIEWMSKTQAKAPAPAAHETVPSVPAAEERKPTSEVAPPSEPVIIAPHAEPQPEPVAAFVTEPTPPPEPELQPMAAFTSEPPPESEPATPPPPPTPHPPHPT
ncbi:MAG TPA: hypothetical protein VNN08_05275, partial [Thermoanaerobaculia bacterium]|nr:hypothetical protein [Thermoanaerobaculia bacterium]